MTSDTPTNMFILLTTSLHVLLSTDVVAQVTFDTPPPGGATITIAEDKAVGSGIYTLQATDPAGNVPGFTILSQSPSTPPFSIDATDSLVVSSLGLDAENATEFNLTFRVTAGSSTADSDLLTVRVTDVNDNAPVFQNTPYTGEVWKNNPAGTIIATVTATDPDIIKLPITYSIAGAQTTFSVDTSGVITLADPAGLTSLSSPTVLQVHASDGGRTGTAAVTITIHDDPCSSTPCQNGGTCTSTLGTYTCTCLSGYDGDRCQSVDYCYQDPCQNSGTCTNKPTTYTCSCPCSHTGQNCTTAVTSPFVCPKRSDSVDIGLVVAIVMTVLCSLCIVIVFCLLTRKDNTVDKTETSKHEANETDEEKYASGQTKKQKRGQSENSTNLSTGV